MNEQEPSKVELTTLKLFVEDYHRTLTVAGVFGALGLLWRNIRPEQPVPYISYLCLAIVVLLLWEVRRGFSYQKSTWSLVIFINLFSAVVVLMAFNLVAEHAEHFEGIVMGLVMAFFVTGASAAANRYANYLSRRAYLRIMSFQESLVQNNVPQEKLNEIMVQENVKLQKFYRVTGVLEFILFALGMLLSLFAAVYAAMYLRAFFDVLLDRNAVIPPVPLP